MAPTRSSARIVRLALLVGGFGQLPAVLLLAWLLGLPAALAIAAVLSAPFCLRVARGLARGGEERGPMALALLLFYAFWGASMTAALAFVPALLVAYLAGGGSAQAAAGALVLGGVTGLAGVSWNRRPRLRIVELSLPGLDPALDGLRIGQLSDVHMGGHTTPERVRGWVDRLNALGCDLIAITGDLITTGDSHLERVAVELGRLRAADTVAVCLGNHDYFASTSCLVAALREAGLEVLRNEGRVIERETGGRYFLAGIDDTWTGRADPARALGARPRDLAAPACPSIVLAHDPNLFDECAALGASLVLSGHTHGGQVAVPLFPRVLNIARLACRRTAGLYRSGASVLYVSRGAGTTGPALRIGSPAEITLLVLSAA